MSPTQIRTAALNNIHALGYKAVTKKDLSSTDEFILYLDSFLEQTIQSAKKLQVLCQQKL